MSSRVLLGELLPGLVEVEAELAGDALEDLLEEGRVAPLPGLDGALAQAQLRVGHDELLVEDHARADAVAARAGAVRVVEREEARRDLGEADAALGAGELLGEEQVLALERRDLDQRRSASLSASSSESASRCRDAGLAAPGGRRRPRWCAALAVSSVERRRRGRRARRRWRRATKPSRRSSSSSFLNSPLRSRTTGASTEKRVPSGSAQQRSTICWTVCEAIGAAAARAVRLADARVEQPQVVVDLGDRADRRARVPARALRCSMAIAGRQALDGVDVGLAHLLEELARVGRERLDVAALPLGVDGVERERGLARAREAGDDHELVARDARRRCS